MKKIIYIAIAAIFAAPAMAQPVSDRGVIPVAVTLNQILRLNITNGGNIEFVFNTIAQYKNGIVNSAMYDTDFNVASSTPWQLDLGAEDAAFLTTQDTAGNTLALNNVGYIITESGLHDFGTELDDISIDPILVGKALQVFPDPIIGSGGVPPTNAGDIVDNQFTINWECGTSALANMNANPILDQGVAPDRYVTNVLLDIYVAP